MNDDNLRELLKLEKENNKLLHKIRNSMIIARVIKGLYWAIIIGSAFGLYWFLQPYIDSITGLYTNAANQAEQFSTFISNFVGGETPTE